MEGVEKRFNAGYLSKEDMSTWIKSGSPSEVYEILTGFWGTDIPQPEVILDSNKNYFTPSEPDKIFICPKGALKSGDVLRSLGKGRSLDNVLKTTVGEEFTHYMNHALVPLNFEREYQMGQKYNKTREYSDLLDNACMGSQIEAVGYIGRKQVGKKIGIKNYDDIERRIKNTSGNILDKEFREALVLRVLGTLGSVNNLELEEAFGIFFEKMYHHIPWEA